ncbi:hypothetical protein [Streptomyces sp. RK75]|uniref:hypothetical protein n=1 Tax=Streptomyces sp. RK75 TaxID=2824895 RepID=UPI001B37F266|nr:hypothetical protein [Streptomyces sp. RK75]MBQ0867403.1 hypothetical protein [Streptomyces sp. RK75]
MHDLDLAYLAGVIDSDGYITVHRSLRNGKAYYAARIGIAGTRRQPHDLAVSLWGGRVSRYEPKSPRHRAQYQWSRTGDTAAIAITQIQPHLRVKREQARLALEAQEHVVFGRGENPYPWMPADYDPEPLLARLRDEVVHVLNQDRRAAAITPRQPSL